MIKEKIQTTI